LNDIRPAALARRALAFLVLSTVGLAACSTSGGAHEAAPVVTDGPSGISMSMVDKGAATIILIP